MNFEEIYYQKEPYQNVLPNFEKTSKIKFGQLYGTRSGDKVAMLIWCLEQE